MYKYREDIIDQYGKKITNASIVVSIYPSGTATIYSDDGITPIANATVTTNADGEFTFYAPSGHYTLSIYRDGVLYRTVQDVQMEGVADTAPVTPSYLVLGTNGVLTNERVLTAGTNVSFVDGGAGSTLTINASSGSSLTGSTGASNTVLGVASGTAITSGIRNVSIGVNALTTVTTGGDNTAGGFDALTNVTSGENTAFGARAGRNISGGTGGNVAFGTLAMGNATPSNVNSATALGYQALVNVTGANNTGVGHNAGAAGTPLTSGANNTFVGESAQVNSATASRRTVIGASAIGIVDNCVQLGVAGDNTAIGAGALSTSATDGFLYIPTCAGTPTGVPTSINGLAPVVFDTTNLKICVYTGGAWKKTAALT